MHRHHIIPRHEWRQRFESLEGFNSPDNIVVLTVEQHALAHKYLYELLGSEYDKIAYLFLSGQIGKEEAIKESIVCANKGRPKTPEECAAISSRMNGKRLTLGYKQRPRSESYKNAISDRMKGKKIAKGSKHTDEWKIANSERMNGNKHSLGVKRSDEFKRKVSLGMKGKQNSLGNKNALGNRHTLSDEFKRKCRERMIGNQRARKTQCSIEVTK